LTLEIQLEFHGSPSNPTGKSGLPNQGARNRDMGLAAIFRPEGATRSEQPCAAQAFEAQWTGWRPIFIGRPGPQMGPGHEFG
jgi:hypothetical protein